MKKLNRNLSLAFMAIMSLSVALSFAWSPAIKGCHQINAKGESVITFQHREALNMETDIRGGGLLNGSIQTSILRSSNYPVISGRMLITTKHGNLEFNIPRGIYGNGEFSTTAYVIEGSGTGKLAGATGTLQLESVEENPDGSFTLDIDGEICFD